MTRVGVRSCGRPPGDMGNVGLRMALTVDGRAETWKMKQALSVILELLNPALPGIYSFYIFLKYEQFHFLCCLKQFELGTDMYFSHRMTVTLSFGGHVDTESRSI